MKKLKGRAAKSQFLNWYEKLHKPDHEEQKLQNRKK